MNYHYSYRTVCFIITLMLCQVSSSSENQNVMVYSLSPNEKISPIEKNVTEMIKTKIIDHELSGDFPVKWELLIAVKELEQNSIAIAVTILQSLPREVIEAGSKSQIVYAFLEKDKSIGDSEQNQEIREYVTSEFLSNYKQAIESEIVITKSENIEKTCSKIVDRFVKKYL